MDPDICRWILEFLLMSSVPDSIVKNIWNILPHSGTDSRLGKVLALRSIQAEVAAASFTEMSLECLEVIQEIDRLDGIAITQAMKEAYCAVAVDCSVRYVEACPDKNHGGLFDDAINRIWRGRVRKMMEAMALGKRSHLFTAELIGWKDVIESARWDAEVCGRLMNMNNRQNALDKVRVYLKETWASMGPCFLELVATVSEDKGLGSSRRDKMGDAELAVGCSKGVSESFLVFDQMNMCKGKLHCSTNTTEEGLVVSDGSALNNAAICKEKGPVAGGNQDSEQLGKGVVSDGSASYNAAICKEKGPVAGGNQDSEQLGKRVVSDGSALNNAAVCKEKVPVAGGHQDSEQLGKRVVSDGSASYNIAICMEKVPVAGGHQDSEQLGKRVVSDGSASYNAAVCMEKAPVAGGNQDSEQLGKRVVSDGSASYNAAICMEKAPVAGGNQDSEQLGKRVVSDGSASYNAAVCMEKAPVAGGNPDSDQLGKGVVFSVGGNQALGGTDLPQGTNGAIQKGKLPLEHNHAAPSTRRGVKIIDDGKGGPATVCSRDHNASNIQVEKLRKSLMSSSLELRALVNDPLPDALHKSDTVRSELATKGVNHEPPFENQSTVIDVPEPNTCRSMVLYQPTNDVSKKQSSANCSNVRRPSWMERNSTAHTYEWDDPFNDLPEGSHKKRRRRWSSEEEDALRDGVKKFGKGNWKPILRYYSEIFKKTGRTEVDLKDKWRNLTRWS